MIKSFDESKKMTQFRIPKDSDVDRKEEVLTLCRKEAGILWSLRSVTLILNTWSIYDIHVDVFIQIVKSSLKRCLHDVGEDILVFRADKSKEFFGILVWQCFP